VGEHVKTNRSTTAGVHQRHRKSCGRTGNCRCAWAFYVELPPGADGRRRQVTKGGFTGSRAAKTARDQVLADVRAGLSVDNRMLTVGEYLTSWLDAKVAAEAVRPKTEAAYRDHVTRFFLPTIGSVRLADLTPRHIERAFAAIRAEHPNLSASSLSRIRATLRSALNTAVKRGEIARNAAQYIDTPPIHRTPVRPWEPEEVAAFLDAPTVRAHRLHPLFHVAIFTGLRRGELAGLRWQDIDLDGAALTVRQQIVNVGAKTWVTPPKTASGENRRVDLDGATVAVLRSLKATQSAERLAWGPGWADTGLVFAKEDGTGWHPDSIRQAFDRLIHTVKVDGQPLRRVRFHDLRHAQASLMLAAGVPLAVVSKRLGHSQLAVTSDTYSHLIAGAGKAAAEAAAALVQPRSTAIS
jgi:integrase